MFLIARKEHNRAGAVLAGLQFFLWASSSHRADLTHAMINAFPAVLFLGSRLQSANRLRANRFLARLLMAAVLTGALSGQMRASLFGRETPLAQSQTVFSSPEIKAARHLFFGPFMPGLYFETRKPNPFPNSHYLECDETCYRNNLEVFRAVRPEFAFLNYAMAEKYRYNPNNPLEDHIRKNYRFCPRPELQNLRLYARDDCPAGV